MTAASVQLQSHLSPEGLYLLLLLVMILRHGALQLGHELALAVCRLMLCEGPCKRRVWLPHGGVPSVGQTCPRIGI